VLWQPSFSSFEEISRPEGQTVRKIREVIIMTRWKKLVPFLLGTGMFVALVPAVSTGARGAHPPDLAPLYKTKCASCHGATAQKKFDATKSDDDLLQILLKGKKAEKPPNMPAYEGKIKEEDAKALIAWMKAQKH
jgi:mono/diheme cytochrome c family protein